MQNMTQENLSYCRNIRNELEKYYHGSIYKCPECGEIICIPDIDDLEEGDAGIKLTCGCIVDDINELEQLSLYDYFSDVFDIVYYIDTDKEVIGVRIMVACGGPNIYIDTYRKTVELYWWTEYAATDLRSDLCEEITSQFAEVY